MEEAHNLILVGGTDTGKTPLPTAIGVAGIHKGIRSVLEITHGNKLQAGKILDIDRGTLYRKLGNEV